MTFCQSTTRPFRIKGAYLRRIYGLKRLRRLLGHLRQDRGSLHRTLKGQDLMGKWTISRTARLAIMLRDGLCCAWCAAAVEDGAVLTLDHLCCRSAGGGDNAENLVTACLRCNGNRGSRAVDEFASAVAAYLDIDARLIREHIEFTRRQPVDTEAASRLLISRGSLAAALYGDIQVNG